MVASGEHDDGRVLHRRLADDAPGDEQLQRHYRVVGEARLTTEGLLDGPEDPGQSIAALLAE